MFEGLRDDRFSSTDKTTMEEVLGSLCIMEDGLAVEVEVWTRKKEYSK